MTTLGGRRFQFIAGLCHKLFAKLVDVLDITHSIGGIKIKQRIRKEVIDRAMVQV